MHPKDVLARYLANPTKENCQWLTDTYKHWFGGQWQYKLNMDTRGAA